MLGAESLQQATETKKLDMSVEFEGPTQTFGPLRNSWWKILIGFVLRSFSGSKEHVDTLLQFLIIMRAALALSTNKIWTAHSRLITDECFSKAQKESNLWVTWFRRRHPRFGRPGTIWAGSGHRPSSISIGEDCHAPTSWTDFCLDWPYGQTWCPSTGRWCGRGSLGRPQACWLLKPCSAVTKVAAIQ